MYNGKMEDKQPLKEKKGLSKPILIIGITVLCFLFMVFIAVVIKKAVTHEAQKAKTEMVEKVKTTINDSTADKAALITAKTIHGLKTFKDKIKRDLKSLDSADTAK